MPGGEHSNLRPKALHMLRRELHLGCGGDYAEDGRRTCTRGTRDSLFIPKREPAVQPPNDRQDREINIKIAIQWIALDL